MRNVLCSGVLLLTLQGLSAFPALAKLPTVPIDYQPVMTSRVRKLLMVAGIKKGNALQQLACNQFHRGERRKALENYQDAVVILNQLIKVAPDEAEVYYNKAVALANVGYTEQWLSLSAEAKASFSDAISACDGDTVATDENAR